ncbi:hypothetical protein GCM10007874_61290 [Labrys miyagiensis]|uniref:Uncharacterized protein n=2 Tax=Labrys miyagiensis TaxID=346912 RepID=A0ABQ6CSJ2_9HYPH|nr:hypothetical protein GCM10007874_61290 [Labrys miyagiensis]
MTIGMAIGPLGLRRLDHLALRLNGLVARHVIPEWQLGGWMQASRKRLHILLGTQSNAATDGELTKARP